MSRAVGSDDEGLVIGGMWRKLFRMITILTTLAAGVLAIAGVLIGERRGSRSQRDHWLRDVQLRACARLMDELGVVYIALTDLRDGRGPDLNWVPFNQALTAVSLICDSSVIEAAYRLDEALWRAHRAVRHGMDENERWSEIRKPVESSRRNFIESARLQLAPRSTTPAVLSGRPPEDDPIWTRGKTP